MSRINQGKIERKKILKIVQPEVEVFFHYPHEQIPIEQFLECVGRTCYKSEDKITKGSAKKFISMLYERGHHAMLEHCVASCKFVCDRGVSHELVRHRLASFAQESTRYCNYGKDKFGNEISVIEPPGLDSIQKDIWKTSCLEAERCYLNLIKLGTPAQIARSVLPTCLKTEIWTTTNLREWMHIFKLRCSNKAHPQIRELMLQAQEIFAKKIPSMFSKED